MLIELSDPAIVTSAAGAGGVLGAALLKAIDLLGKKNDTHRNDVLETKIDHLTQTCRDGFDRVVGAVERADR